MHVVTPGHSQFALQPGTHWWPTQMRPEPSLPGLQSPSELHDPPPLLPPPLEPPLEPPLLDPLLLPLDPPLLEPLLDPLLPPLDPPLDPPLELPPWHGSSTM